MYIGLYLIFREDDMLDMAFGLKENSRLGMFYSSATYF